MKMLKTVVLGAIFLIQMTAQAAVTPLINYQGYLANGNNEPVNGSVNLFLRLYDAPVGEMCYGQKP
jgi:hypothetical protein